MPGWWGSVERWVSLDTKLEVGPNGEIHMTTGVKNSRIGDAYL